MDSLDVLSRIPQSILSLPAFNVFIPRFGSCINQPVKVALLVVSLTSTAYLLQRSIVSYLSDDVRRLKGPPPAEASSLFGHELTIWEGEATEAYTKWTEKYGSFMKIQAAFWQGKIVIATDHSAVRHICANTNNYVKAPHLRPAIKLVVGTGLNWAEGADHANLRRLFMPIFTSENVQKMDTIIIDCAEGLERRLIDLTSSANGDNPINIIRHTSAFTLDVIGRVGFDYNFQGGASPEAEAILDEWHRSINAGLQKSSFLASRVLRVLPFLIHLPNKEFEKLGQIRRITMDIASKIYDQKEAAIDSGIQLDEHGSAFLGKDLMTSLMLANRREKGGLSKERILNNISTMLLVGHETAALTISYILYELARDQDIQSKLREEIRRMDKQLSSESVNKLTYLDAVVKEVLRIHPAGPYTQRVALRDDIIPLTEPIVTDSGEVLRSVRIHAGQEFHVSMQTMNTRPSVWGPDSYVFRPERWLEPSGIPSPSDLPHGWSSTMAFLDGPRNCIGYRLALLEVKIAVVALVRSIQFHDAGAKVIPKFTATLQPVVDGEAGVLPLRMTLI